jgi:lipoprotein-anchoring transpeptidase ErfK/SrfK
MLPDGFAALPVDEHIVFDSTLFVPPFATRNRQVDGELGRFLLDLGDGYLFHGTPYEESIGTAATHGCLRLRDEDIAWLYDQVPIGTRVYIY